jgi:hypothetical protein
MLMMQQQVINNVSWQRANFWKLVMKPELGTVIITSRTRQRGHLFWSFYVIGTHVEFGTSEIGTSYKFSSILKGFLHEIFGDCQTTGNNHFSKSLNIEPVICSKTNATRIQL